jgi:hypothetical protein
VPGVAEIHSTPGDPGLAVARYPRWEDRVEEVDAAQHRFKQVNWRSETHQVTHAAIAIEFGNRCLDCGVALFRCFIASKSTEVDPFERE